MEWLLLGALALLIGWQVRLVVRRLQTVQIERRGETNKARAARQRAERAEPGAIPKAPIPIDSPSVVEPYVVGLKCLKCGAQHRLHEHAALTMDGVRLRKAVAECRNCGNRRSLYFRLRERLN